MQAKKTAGELSGADEKARFQALKIRFRENSAAK